MMVWLAEKGRVPACCHSLRSRYAHVECVCGVLCGGEKCDWMRVVKRKRRARAREEKEREEKSVQKCF